MSPLRLSGVPGLLLLLSSAVAQAQTDPWATAQPLTISMSNFKYVPPTVTLRAGVAYLIHFENHSAGGHNFVAPDFFAEARIAPDDSSKVAGGRVSFHGNENLDLRLIATQPGTYKVHCSHFMHSAFGMTGRIVVE